MKYLSFLLLASLALFIACKPNTDAEKTDDDENGGMTYKITAFEESHNYPDATLSNMRYEGGIFTFDVTGEEYSLGVQTPDADSKMCANSDKGQHIHLIVDNDPYSAQYENSFNYDVDDGQHYILAFLSRSYHESLKHKSASILKKVNVENGAIASQEDVSEAILTYSRPKGTYVGKDTEKIMLDFYLSNVSLGNGYSVEAKINDEIHTLDRWQPYYIEGLPMGENSITLTLMKDDEKVNTPLNPVTRNFTLKADPLEEK